MAATIILGTRFDAIIILYHYTVHKRKMMDGCMCTSSTHKLIYNLQFILCQSSHLTINRLAWFTKETNKTTVRDRNPKKATHL